MTPVSKRKGSFPTGEQRVRWLHAVTLSLLLFLALVPPIGVARAYLDAFEQPGSPVRPLTDAITYLAAGERLNAGHNLYDLRPDDRQVDTNPEVFRAPLVSPPPLAVIWRPLAFWNLGLLLWVVGCWVALLGTVAYLVIRVGTAAGILALLLAIPIGEQLAVANVSAYFPAILVMSWRFRHRSAIGFGLGMMATVKLTPIVTLGWLAATKRFGALTVAMISIAFASLTSIIGSGIESYIDYSRVVTETRASAMSLSGLFGLPWLTYAVLVAGALASAATGRWAGVSFAVAVITLTLGTPALYRSGLVPLIALAAPLIRDSIPPARQIGRRPTMLETA